MSFCNRFVLPVVAVLSLTFLIACGSSSHSVTPPPTGGFSNSNLKGTYVFTINGFDAGGDFVVIAGTFAANGTGGNNGITGGTVDFNDSGFTPASNISITGGSYSVTSDGRGQATLAVATPWGAPTLTVDFVLSSSTSGFITQFDINGTGSGTLDLQTAASQPAAGTYVVGLSGVTNGLSGTPGTLAGAITLDASGNATGSFDYNVGGAAFLFSLTSGSNVTVSGTPGTATFVTSTPTLNFHIYPIDATHMKFIEMESSGFPNLSGDLFQQTSSTFPSGTLVFTMAGDDSGTALAVGGVMTSNTTISNGEEDFNDGGTTDTNPQQFSGKISGSGPRYQITLNGFMNGSSGLPSYTFAAYPYGAGVEIVETDGAGITAGVAYAQGSSPTITSGQGYGLNLSGNNPEDIIAEFTTTSTGFSGGIDDNDVVSGNGLAFDKNFGGNYTMDSPATGRGVFNVTNSASNSSFGGGAIYAISGTQILLLEADSSGQVGLGALEQQNAGAASSSLSNSNLAQHHLAVIKAALATKKKAKKQ